MDLYLFVIGFISRSSLRNAHFLWAKTMQEYRTVNSVFRTDIGNGPMMNRKTGFSGVIQI